MFAALCNSRNIPHKNKTERASDLRQLCYPLVNVYRTMEHHHVQWVNQLTGLPVSIVIQYWFTYRVSPTKRLAPCCPSCSWVYTLHVLRIGYGPGEDHHFPHENRGRGIAP